MNGLLNEALSEIAHAQFQTPPRPLVDSMKPVAPVAPFPAFTQGTYIPSLTGRLDREVVIREVNTKRGPLEVADLHLTDGSRTVKISLWEGLAHAADSYNAGETITLTALSVKNPYQNIDQLGSTGKTQIS